MMVVVAVMMEKDAYIFCLVSCVFHNEYAIWLLTEEGESYQIDLQIRYKKISSDVRHMFAIVWIFNGICERWQQQQQLQLQKKL